MVAVVMVRIVMWGGGGGGGASRRVAQRRRDGGRLDGDDSGVHDLAVDLHHHLVAPRRVIQALCGGGRGGILTAGLIQEGPVLALEDRTSQSTGLTHTHRSQTWPASPGTFWGAWFYCG